MADYTTSNDSNASGKPASRLSRRAAGSGVAIFIAALVVLVLIGFFASHSGIDRKYVKKRLDEWTQYASQMAEIQGYTVEIVYKEIDIEGGLFSKKAVLRAPELRLTPQGGGADQARTLTTGVLYLKPSMVGGALTVSAPEPLMFTNPGGRMRITSGEPLEMLVEEYGDDTGSGLAYTLNAPPHLSIERLGRQSDAVVKATDVTFGEKSTVHGMVDRTAGTYTQEATFHNVALKRNERTVSLDRFNSVMEMASENGSLLTHYTLDAKNAKTNGPLESFGAVNAELDMEFEEPVRNGGEALNLSLGNDRNVVVEKLLLETQSGKVLTKAKLRQIQNELMPFGTASVELEHPLKLLETLSKTEQMNNIPPELIMTMLGRVVPEWKGDDTPVTVLLKREQDGPFYIGSLTFEEFTAILLTQLLQQSTGDIPLMQTPGATAPATGGEQAPAGEAAPQTDGQSGMQEGGAPAASAPAASQPAAPMQAAPQPAAPIENPAQPAPHTMVTPEEGESQATTPPTADVQPEANAPAASSNQ